MYIRSDTITIEVKDTVKPEFIDIKDKFEVELVIIWLAF